MILHLCFKYHKTEFPYHRIARQPSNKQFQKFWLLCSSNTASGLVALGVRYRCTEEPFSVCMSFTALLSNSTVNPSAALLVRATDVE